MILVAFIYSGGCLFIFITLSEYLDTLPGRSAAGVILFWPIALLFFGFKGLYLAILGLIDIFTGKVK